MNSNLILAVISIIFGLLVIVFKDLLNYVVGIFFILLGIWLLLDYFGEKKSTEKGTAPPSCTGPWAIPARTKVSVFPSAGGPSHQQLLDHTPPDRMRRSSIIFLDRASVYLLLRYESGE